MKILQNNMAILGYGVAIILLLVAIFVVPWFMTHRRNSVQSSPRSIDNWNEDDVDLPPIASGRTGAKWDGVTDMRIGGQAKKRRNSVEMSVERDEAPAMDDHVAQGWLLRSTGSLLPGMALRFTVDRLRQEFVIGRSIDDSDLVVDAEEVSRRHAMLRLSAGRLEIRDLRSSNGTWLNGTKMKPDLWQALDIPSDIKLGSAKFRIEAAT